MQPLRYAVLAMVWFNVLLAAWLSAYMLYDPEGWYYFVPGVTDTGLYNQHFIRDIGIIQGFIALAFAIGWFSPGRRIELWGGCHSLADRTRHLSPLGSCSGDLFGFSHPTGFSCSELAGTFRHCRDRLGVCSRSTNGSSAECETSRLLNGQYRT
ncbi:hypothetical protein [Ensifer canadensis]